MTPLSTGSAAEQARYHPHAAGLAHREGESASERGSIFLPYAFGRITERQKRARFLATEHTGTLIAGPPRWLHDLSPAFGELRARTMVGPVRRRSQLARLRLFVSLNDGTCWGRRGPVLLCAKSGPDHLTDAARVAHTLDLTLSRADRAQRRDVGMPPGGSSPDRCSGGISVMNPAVGSVTSSSRDPSYK